jgi:hypothetical protein
MPMALTGDERFRDLHVVARRVARLRDSLRRTPPADPDDLARALDHVGESLDRLRQAIDDDDDMVLRLCAPRDLAASYVRATRHLTEAGVDESTRTSVLLQGSDRVRDALAAVEEQLELQSVSRGAASRC